jgi:hypothetical protein
LIDIPSATGRFNIKPSDGPKVHVGELLTLIGFFTALIDPNELQAKAIKLPRQQVESWEKQWGARSTKFELEGGAGLPMTEKEQAARNNNAQELTQDDPAPQTVYRMAIKTSDSIVLRRAAKVSPVAGAQSWRVFCRADFACFEFASLEGSESFVGTRRPRRLLISAIYM